MTINHAIRTTVPAISLAGASALAAAIIVVAPEVGRELLLMLIGGWVVLAVVRVVIFVGLIRSFYQKIEAAQAAH